MRIKCILTYIIILVTTINIILLPNTVHSINLAIAAESSLSEQISPSNQHYPVYNSLIIALNNETNEGLQASVRIYNSTSNKWQINTPFISKVSKDMNSLANQITGLQEIYFYEYNDTSLPGTLFFLLCTTFDLAKEVYYEVFDSITTNAGFWWYVANVSFPVLNLTEFDVWQHGNFDYIVPDIVSVSTGKVVDFDNGTVLIQLNERDGILSAPLLYNNDSSTLLRLNSSEAYFIDPINLTSNPLFLDVIQGDVNGLQQHYFKLYNVTLDLLSIGLSQYERNKSVSLNEMCALIIAFNYPTDTITYELKFRLYFLLNVIYSHLWYVNKNYVIVAHSAPHTSFSPGIGFFIALGVSILTLVAIASFVIRRLHTTKT